MFGVSGAGKTTTLLSFLAHLSRWLPGLPGDGKNELQVSSNVLQRASGVSDRPFMLGYVVAQMEQREISWAKRGHVKCLGLKASEVGHSVSACR